MNSQSFARAVGQAFNALHMMHHEATACHVTGDIVDLLRLIAQVLKVARQYMGAKKGTATRTSQVHISLSVNINGSFPQFRLFYCSKFSVCAAFGDMCVSDLERRVAASEVKPHLCNWKERVELTQKLLTLLNSFTPPEVRQHTFGKSNAVCLLCLYTLHICTGMSSALLCSKIYYMHRYI